MKTTQKLPAALAVQRALIITDGIFRNIKERAPSNPVLVIEHGVRGTQNVSKDGYKKEVANPQRTESAKLDEDADGLFITFDLRTADLDHGLTMCSEPRDEKKTAENFRASLIGFIKRAKTTGALDMLARRYARNILNARWIWRNRSYAQSIRVVVLEVDGTAQKVIADIDALRVPLEHFDVLPVKGGASEAAAINDAETAIAKILAQGWSGDRGAALRVEASVDFGVRGALEVYPSQNYCEKKKGFARSLFKLPLRGLVAHDELGSGFTVVGRAALRDQKIANALRTIDTWHSGFGASGIVAPVEPMGASLEFAVFLREKEENAFELLKKLAVLDPSSSEGQYILAVLIRGGVFGEGAEKKKGDKDDKDDSLIDPEAAE